MLAALAFSAATRSRTAGRAQIWSTPGVGAASRHTYPSLHVSQPYGRFQQPVLLGQMPGEAVQEHVPAEQVKLVPHGTGADGLQAPPEHVGGSTRSVLSEQDAVPHVPVG